VPLQEDPDDPKRTLLVDAAGRPLASTRLRADDRVAGGTRLQPGADPAAAAREALVDLAGMRLATTEQALADALLRAGAFLHRVAVDMTHDLSDLPPPPPLPRGWALGPGRWDADLASAVAEAYGPDHVDGPWGEQDTARVAAAHAGNADLKALASATARIVDPDGRSAGHVLCAGPVPWVDESAWVLTIALAYRARRLGLGRVLLVHALRGTREAGLSKLGLSVTDGNPARRLYEAAGFRPVIRVLSLRLPETSCSAP
jgi:mycothiol synthase